MMVLDKNLTKLNDKCLEAYMRFLSINVYK